MPSFVKVGQRMVNLDYVSRVEPNDNGTATIYVDDSPPQTVPVEDVSALMDALRPPTPATLLEAQPFVGGGLGGEGLPAGMFRNAPEPTPLTPVPETPLSPPVETPAPLTPETPVTDPAAAEVPVETPAESPPEAAAETPAEDTTKPKAKKTATK